MIMVQESQTLSQGSNEQVPAGQGREVEVAAVAKRRQFSTTYKRQIVRKAAACEAVGGIGELLRQEGLYSSHLAKWRRELEADEQVCLSTLDQTLMAEAEGLGWKAEVQRCRAVPGVGPLTALALVALSHRGQFASADAFIAFMGMDIRVRQSGQWRGRCKLTKQGDPEVRRLLFNAAMQGRRNPVLTLLPVAARARHEHYGGLRGPRSQAGAGVLCMVKEWNRVQPGPPFRRLHRDIESILSLA